MPWLSREDSLVRLRSSLLRIVAVMTTVALAIVGFSGAFEAEWVTALVGAAAVCAAAVAVFAIRARSISTWVNLSSLSALMVLVTIIAVTVEQAPLGSITGYVFLGIAVAVAACEPIRPAIVFGAVALALGVTAIVLRSAVPYAAAPVFAGMLCFAVYIVIRFRRIAESARDLAISDSLRDPLTGLANRRGMEASVADLQRIGAASGALLACLILDLDHFKRVNDAHGHAEGDLMLRRASVAIREAARDDDVIVRLGGEEFGVFCLVPDAHALRTIAERIRAAIEGMGGTVPITTSVGGAYIEPTRRDAITALLRASDRQLYLAKRQGRNVVSLADAVGSGGERRELRR